MRWTLEDWLGLRKIREDWNEGWPEWLGPLAYRRGFGLAKDGLGHVLIGLLVGLIPAYVGHGFQPSLFAALVIGVGREVAQFTLDATPNPNLVDRAKDVAEVALGGWVVGILL